MIKAFNSNYSALQKPKPPQWKDKRSSPGGAERVYRVGREVPWRCRGVWSDVGDAPRVTFTKEFRAKLFCILQSAVNAAGLQVGGTRSIKNNPCGVCGSNAVFVFGCVRCLAARKRDAHERHISFRVGRPETRAVSGGGLVAPSRDVLRLICFWWEWRNRNRRLPCGTSSQTVRTILFMLFSRV